MGIYITVLAEKKRKILMYFPTACMHCTFIPLLKGCVCKGFATANSQYKNNGCNCDKKMVLNFDFKHNKNKKKTCS